MKWSCGTGRGMEAVEGDITRIAVDAIVNAANSALAGGGGVDGAIHRAGGPEIMRELDELRRVTGGCPTGSAVATGAGRLPARFVFHSVGPIYRGGERGEPDLLASCYRTCLKLAEDRGLSSLSFPAISTGVYGYPIRPAAEIAVREVKAHLEKADASLQRVVFVLFSRSDYKVYARLLERLPSIHAE